MSVTTAKTVAMVKEPDGTVTIVIGDRFGTALAVANVPAADFTAFNTTVNGGANGATLTKSYGQIDKKTNIIPHDLYDRD